MPSIEEIQNNLSNIPVDNGDSDDDDFGPFPVPRPRGPNEAPFNEEEFLRDMEKVPLFMTGVKKEDSGIGESGGMEMESEALEALRELVYDGTPEGNI